MVKLCLQVNDNGSKGLKYLNCYTLGREHDNVTITVYPRCAPDKDGCHVILSRAYQTFSVFDEVHATSVNGLKKVLVKYLNFCFGYYDWVIVKQTIDTKDFEIDERWLND